MRFAQTTTALGFAVAFLILCGFAASGRAADAPAKAAPKEKVAAALVGKWKLKAMREGGKESGDKVPDITLTLLEGGKAEGELPNGSFKATYHLDLEATPMNLDLKHETGPYAGEPQFCSFKLDGDLLTLVATHPGAEANDRPTDLDNDRGFVFERVKEAKKP